MNESCIVPIDDIVRPLPTEGPFPVDNPFATWEQDGASDALRFGIRALYEEIHGRFNEKDMDRIRRALSEAHRYHQNSPKERQKTRADGTEYTTHLVAVARIVNYMDTDADTVCGALLHDVLENTEMTRDEVKAFGDNVLAAVEYDTKVTDDDIDRLYPGAPASDRYELEKAETYKKIILSIDQEKRALAIKLADRLHNMATLQYLKEPKAKEIALETLRIYMPIAKAVGATNFANAYKEYAVKTLWPDVYNTAEKIVAQRRQKEDVVPVVSSLFRVGQKIPYEVPGTVSYIPERASDRIVLSAHGAAIDQSAQHTMRLVLPKNAFEFVMKKAKHVSERGTLRIKKAQYSGEFNIRIGQDVFRILICVPQSVVRDEASIFDLCRREVRKQEYQTKKEYETARNEAGLKRKYAKDKLVNPIRLSRQFTGEHVHDYVASFTEGASQPLMMFKTPAGEKRVIQKNALVLDVAYSIHTDIGRTAIGAKINGKEPVGLTHCIFEGDVVEILTDPQKTWQVSCDHLDVVQPHTQRRVRDDISMMLSIEYEDPEGVSKKNELQRIGMDETEWKKWAEETKTKLSLRGKTLITDLYKKSRGLSDMEEPTMDINRGWGKMPASIRNVHGKDIKRFYQHCGLGLVEQKVCEKYVDGVIAYEDALPAYTLTLPNVPGSQASVTAFVATVANVVSVQAVYPPGLPEGAAVLKMRVEIPEDVQGEFDALLGVYVRRVNQLALPAEPLHTAQEIKIDLPDRRGLAGSFATLIAPFGNIVQSNISVDDGAAHIHVQVAPVDETAFSELEKVIAFAVKHVSSIS